MHYITVFFTSRYFALIFAAVSLPLFLFLLCSLTCPGMDCPEAHHLKKHYPKSSFGLQHTLPPSGPKTSSAERDEMRMQGFPLYRCLRDVSEFEFVVGVLQAESHPG